MTSRNSMVAGSGGDPTGRRPPQSGLVRRVQPVKAGLQQRLSCACSHRNPGRVYAAAHSQRIQRRDVRSSAWAYACVCPLLLRSVGRLEGVIPLFLDFDNLDVSGFCYFWAFCSSIILTFVMIFLTLLNSFCRLIHRFVGLQHD